MSDGGDGGSITINTNSKFATALTDRCQMMVLTQSSRAIMGSRVSKSKSRDHVCCTTSALETVLLSRE